MCEPIPCPKGQLRKGLRLGRLRCHTATLCKLVEGVPNGKIDSMALRCPEVRLQHAG